MKNEDYELIKDQWDALYEKCSALHEEWDKKNGPKTSSDHPDTAAAYFDGYAQATADALKANNGLFEALDNLLASYTSLVNSGDCGFWNPEKDEEVKAARAALKKARP